MNTLTYLVTYLAPFIGVVVGAVVALGAVILTNRGHDRRWKEQLEHDRGQNSRDREMSLRKDIYLAAAEAVSAGLVAIGRFANLDTPHEKLTEGYLDKSPSITKVNIIANEETVRAIAAFSSELHGAMLRLTVIRIPLIAHKQKIELLKAQLDLSLKENNRTLELQKQYNIEEHADPRRWAVLQKNFEFERDRSERARQDADTLTESLIPKQLELLEACIGEATRLGHLLPPMLGSVRKELELPINETELRRISEEITANQHEILKEYMQHLRSLAAAQREVEDVIPSVPTRSRSPLFSPGNTSHSL